MGKSSVANISRIFSDLVKCTRLTGSPLKAYNYLRSRRASETEFFCYGPLRFQGRKEDWSAIREVLADDEYACIDSILPTQSSPRILDLGANIGCFAVRVLSRCPRAQVASVEAARDTFRVLQGNREANSSYSWRVFHNGIWKEDGPLCLMRRGLSVSHCVVEGSDGDSVSGISLATLLRRLGWDHVDLIKMDIEGGEAVVVPATAEILRRARILLIEIHPDRIDTAPVINTLRSVFAHKWQLNSRTSSKPLFVMSSEVLDLGSNAWRVAV